MQHGYSGLDERPKIHHLLGGIHDDYVSPVVCQVLAMKEADKDFTSMTALFSDFLRHKKQDPNACRISAINSDSKNQGGLGRCRDPGRGGGSRGRSGGRCG